MSKHNGRNGTREIESAELVHLRTENAKLKREMGQLRLVAQLGVEQPELRPFAKQLAKLAAECLDTAQAWIGLIEDDGARVLAFYHDGETHTPDALSIPLNENLSGLVWHKRHAALVVDAAHDPAIPEAFRREFDCRSALCVPMMDSRNEILGVIQWHNRRDGLPFTEADVAMGEAVAMQSTVAFERSRSHSHMGQWLGAIENLFAFNTVMNERLDPNVLVKRLVEYACGFLGADGGLAGLTRESHLHTSSYFNGNAWLSINRCWDAQEGLPGWVAMSRCPYLSNEYADDLHADKEWLARFNVGYVICVPIVDADSQLLGFVELHKQKGRAPFTWMDAGFLESLANITAIAISNAGLVRALETNRAEATALSAQHVTWIEEERRRLARELHDETGQALIGIKLGLQAVARHAENDQSELRHQLDHLREQVNQAAVRLKATARMLRPPTLDELGLDAALRQLALDFQTNADTRVDVFGSAQSRLPPMVETACYRIAQEALTNAVKHGNAQHIRVELACHDHTLVLNIEDDGTGFDPYAQSKNGLGLPGMKERAAMLGGTLTVQSSRMHGTRIIASIPIGFTDDRRPATDDPRKMQDDSRLTTFDSRLPTSK